MLVLAVGLGSVFWFGSSRDAEPPPEAIVQLGEESGRMTDARFVELTREVLRSDRRYHSAMFQIMEQYGVETDLYSLDRRTEGYDILKNLIYSGDITCPFHPLLFMEIESLVKMTESKIDHQAGMSKDMADAWAGSSRGVLKLIEDGKIGGEMDGWSGMSVNEIVEGVEKVTQHTDVDFAVRPRYAPDIEGDEFWAGGAIEWDRS